MHKPRHLPGGVSWGLFIKTPPCFISGAKLPGLGGPGATPEVSGSFQSTRAPGLVSPSLRQHPFL